MADRDPLVDMPESEVEKKCNELSDHMAKVFNRYIQRFHKQHGDIAMPVVLNVASRIAVGAVVSFPMNIQAEVLKEFASNCANRYTLWQVGLTPEKSRIRTMN